jgi:hypothetical protein
LKKLIFISLIPLLASAEFIFNGFGTAMVNSLDDSNNPKLMYFDQKSKDGKDYDLSSGTVLGLQGTLYNQNFQIVGQTIFRESVDKEIYQPRLEWLFAKKTFFDDFTISAGRLKLDTFMYSKTLYVDFLRPFMKLPSEIYTSFTFTNHDGVELSHSKMLGDYKISSSFAYSKKNESNIGEVEDRPGLQLDNGSLLSLSVENDNFLVRFAYLFGELSIIDTGNVPENMTNSAEKIYLKMAGFEYSISDFKFSGEYLYKKTSLIENIKSYYIATSYNLNSKFVPYVYYSNMESFRDSIPTPPPGMTLDTNIFANANEPMESYVIGNRYNFSDSLSVKSEFKHSIDTGSKEEINTFALSVDFIF